MIIYCARPITGCSYKDVVDYYAKTTKQLNQYGYEVLHPMTAKAYLKNDTNLKPFGYSNPTATNHAIVSRDLWMDRKADVLYVNFVGAKFVSIGCVSELAVSHDRGKHTVISMDPENVHFHAFILEMADIVFNTHKESMEYLRKLVKQEV